MKPKTIPSLCLVLASYLFVGFVGPATAAPMYHITNLGALPGQTQSVATAINNQDQVVGISYNSADGTFVDSGPYNSTAPPRFHATGDGAQSFQYSNGQMTQINPTGGLAQSINDSGQVVGGRYSSINNAGQYVGGPYSGVDTGTYTGPAELISGGKSTDLGMFSPFAINNSGQVAGMLITSGYVGAYDHHAAVYEGGASQRFDWQIFQGACCVRHECYCYQQTGRHGH